MPKMREVALEHKVHELNSVISAQADRIAELESLVVDMRNDKLREVQLMHRMSGIVPPTSTKYDERMRELGIEV